MKHFLSLFLAAAVLFGAGCATSPAAPAPSTPDTYVPAAPSTPTPSAPAPETPVPTSSTPDATKPSPTSKNAMPHVRIKTTKGDIVIEVNAEMGPLAADNFVKLVKKGFYNGTIFHRVIPGFMIQGGDPTGTGMGGPGYKFDNDPILDKFYPVKDMRVQGQSIRANAYEDGVVAMANSGRNTNGSQFFIMVGDYPLGPDYSMFGKVTQGLDVAHKIADVPVDGNDRPNDDVKMIDVTLE